VKKFSSIDEQIEALEFECNEQRKMVEIAWGIIANVSEGDWNRQNEAWKRAAITWRDNAFSKYRTQNVNQALHDLKL